MDESHTIRQRLLPQREWQSVIAVQVGLVVLLALCRQPLSHLSLSALPPPWNWGVFIGLAAVGIIAGCLWPRTIWLRWLSGNAFAICAMLLLSLLGLLGTIVPQSLVEHDTLAQLGLRGVFHSPPFLLVTLCVLLSLSTVLGRRLATSWQVSNIAFLLVHGGFLLVLFGMLAAPAQFADPFLQIREGESTNEAMTQTQKIYALGGVVQLKKFTLDSFPPKLTLYELTQPPQPGMPMPTYTTSDDPDWVASGHTFMAYGYVVHVLQYLPNASVDTQGRQWVSTDTQGEAVVEVNITTPDGSEGSTWLSAGNDAMGIPGDNIRIDDRHVIRLQESPAREYRSTLLLSRFGQPTEERILKVNHPVRFGAWTLYQSSYQLDPHGNSSIIQAVYDPSIPVVFTGLICIVIGTFLALWRPKNLSQPKSVGEMS